MPVLVDFGKKAIVKKCKHESLELEPSDFLCFGYFRMKVRKRIAISKACKFQSFEQEGPPQDRLVAPRRTPERNGVKVRHPVLASRFPTIC